MTISKHRNPRGLSLVEMLVAMTIFLALSGAVLGLMHYNQRASEKATANADTNTRLLVLFEKLRMELRRGRVVECSPDTLGYWIYRQVDALPVLGTPHRLEFLPGGGVPPDLAQLTALNTEGRLVRRFQGREEPLAILGRDSVVTFEWEPAYQLLRAEGVVGEKNPARPTLESEKTFRFTIPLNNVE